MPKRKRPVEGQEDNALINAERPKRRRNDTTLVDTIQFIFDGLRNTKKEDDTYLCEAFLRVPRKKTEPLYFETIKNPIDMLKIQQKIKTDVYNDLEGFCKDTKLLIENAKTYYAKSTEEYKDACKLWEVFESSKNKAPEEINKRQQATSENEEETCKIKRRGRPPKSSISLSSSMVMEEDGEAMTIKGAIEELFGAVVTAEDSEGRLYSYDFRLLPPKDKYPEYYEVITNPIDLKIIGKRICGGKYEDLNDMDEDLNLMFNNACQFNEPGSRIYKDARILKKLVHMRKEDLHHVITAKRTVKLRCKKAPDGKKWSDLLATLTSLESLPMPADDDEEIVQPPPPTPIAEKMETSVAHDDDDSDEEVESDNPIWQLIHAVRSYSSPTDPKYLLIEPFKRLPNRRWHADYYQEIKNPISLSQIRKKFLRNEYQTVADIVEDFNLMLNNAQKYNRPDSRIYKDAVKLQKFIQTKSEELTVLEEEASDSESEDDEKCKSNKPLTFKRRAKLLFKTLMDYMTEDGRQPIVFFIVKPGEKDYPDYYNVINDPIDMETIETKIKGDKYSGDEDLIADFRLMFKNCRDYNELGSTIYQDSLMLEKVLNEKIKELHATPSGNAATPSSGRESPNSSRQKLMKKIKLGGFVSLAAKNIRLLYTSVKEYRDNGGRQLSEAFLKLPSKTLYPDYYVVIKDPIDLEKVVHKLKTGVYANLDDLVHDLILLFNNACKYNDPDSQIYRDALTLQRLTLQKRLELISCEDGIPRIGALVQELLMSLFISVYNYEEDDGRYTAESFTELPEYQETNGKRSRALSFDIMKRRLDKGLYTKLYYFQEDLFYIFDRARRLSKPDSRLYQDSITLQKSYIKVRNELCNNGATLKSRALDYNEESLKRDLEKVELLMKVEKEEPEDDPNEANDEDDSKPPAQMTVDCSQTNSMKHNQIQYFVGDFVYLTIEKGFQSPIFHIQRMWTNTAGKQMIYGNRYFRPSETFHQPTRKFYPQEVFKTDKYEPHQLTDVTGKCYILPINDYPKVKPLGFEDKDVYVSESRYNTRNRFFKKIKVCPFTPKEDQKLIPRNPPIEMQKVDSIFKERVEKHKEELAEVEEETKVARPPLPNVQRIEPNLHTNNVYYEQYNISSGIIKRGDYVYIRSLDPTKSKKQIRHITRIWTTPEGTSHFQGPVYTSAEEYGSVGDRHPYKQEVFLTAAQDVLPLSDIAGRCSVLHIRDYLSYRLTEIIEKDVYLCECFLDEVNARVSTLQNGLLKFQLSPKSLPDEIYIFKKPMSIQKLESAPPVTIVKKKSEVPTSDFEDSMDGPPPSVTSESSATTTLATPKTLKKMAPGKMSGRKTMTGYILFSTEIRKSITTKNPNANFGEISRLVGIEWKALTEAERKAFEDRVHQMNIENAERAMNGIQDPPAQPGSDIPLPSNVDVAYECMWDGCDSMFEDLFDLQEHLINEANCHLSKVTQIFECAWRGCSRHKKTSLLPFPSNIRLGRHIREVHIQKNTGRVIQHQDRSRTFSASSRKSLLIQDTNDCVSISYPTSNSPFAGLPVMNGHVTTIPKVFDPIFVGTPVKTQRLLHSEAYIKYIENLDKPYISNWERHLVANAENTLINDTGRLPAHWLNGSAGDNGNVVTGLWALREFMMRDSFDMSQAL